MFLHLTLFLSICIKIETYWNVNEFAGKVGFKVGKIKIETYWNVNGSSQSVSNNAKSIKIETYWNVNLPARDSTRYHNN